MLKRTHKGTYHKISVKHLKRYVQELGGRHNIRELDTIDQMGFIASGMVNKILKYGNLVSGEEGRINLISE